MKPGNSPKATPVWQVALRWAGQIAFGLSLSLLIGVSLCFVGRWDEAAVITLPPFWAWAIAGMLLASVGWRRPGGWLPKALLLLWLGLVPIFSGDIRRLMLSPFTRNNHDRASQGPPCVRVVSLNCASQAGALEEVWRWNPDLILLQETPSSNEVARLFQEHLGQEGDFLYGLDCSIIARGKIESMARSRSMRFSKSLCFNYSRVMLSSGLAVKVVSVRLLPPDLRMDLWSLECWRQHRQARQVRRAQFQEVVDLLEPLSDQRPLIVGGDFNAPEGDAIFRLFRGSMKDCFNEAGTGWGNTGINTIPVSRPDQVWINHSSQSVRAWAVRTQNSDHRMVVCDVIMK